MVHPMIPQSYEGPLKISVYLGDTLILSPPTTSYGGFATSQVSSSAVTRTYNVFLHLNNSTYTSAINTAEGVQETEERKKGFWDDIKEYGVMVGIYRTLFVLQDRSTYPTSHVLLSPSTRSLLNSNSTLPVSGVVDIGEGMVSVQGKGRGTKYMKKKVERETRILWKDFITTTTESTTESTTKSTETPSPPHTTSTTTHLASVLSLRLVSDYSTYPYALTNPSMDVRRHPNQPNRLVHLPIVYLDTTGTTSDSYTPLNSTNPGPIALKVTVDPDLRPPRFRLLKHMESILTQQSDLGFTETDIDDVRRLISDTSMIYLAVTVTASMLHLVMEILSFREDVDFWRANDSLRGLSVRSLLSDVICQFVVLLFLVEEDSSMLVIVPSAAGVGVAVWKVHKAMGMRLGTRKSFPYLTYTPTRLTEDPLTASMDRLATATVGRVLIPFIFLYSMYTLVYDRHKSWYGWAVTTMSSLSYAMGFVMMTPQLFLNYKLKSVSHLPWRHLCYKFVSTFIDDLFAFVIRMPVMTRISCFRDDLVFAIFLWQRWNYKVDYSRPYQGDGGGNKKKKNEEEKEVQEEENRKKTN